MSPVATLIILGIASIVWFGFLRRHLASKQRGNGDGGGDFFESGSGHRDHDSAGHDSGDGGGGDGGGDGGD